MVKEYKYTVTFRVIFFIIFTFCLFGAYDIGKSYGNVIALILTICNIYMVLLVFKYRIILTEDYIMVDIGKLGKRIERNWSMIERVWPYTWGMYQVDCKDKPSLIFSTSVDNYIELLSEIIKRAPYAVIDDSIKRLLEKKQNKSSSSYKI